ncbi:MAG: hypothetical protein R3E83_04355 [Burkholderiaceae bacterium]
MADTLNDPARKSPGDLLAHRLPDISGFVTDAHLDQLVGLQREVDFPQDGLGQAGRADGHHGFQMVGEGLERLVIGFGHNGYPGARACSTTTTGY